MKILWQQAYQCVHAVFFQTSKVYIHSISSHYVGNFDAQHKTQLRLFFICDYAKNRALPQRSHVLVLNMRYACSEFDRKQSRRHTPISFLSQRQSADGKISCKPATTKYSNVHASLYMMTMKMAQDFIAMVCYAILTASWLVDCELSRNWGVLEVHSKLASHFQNRLHASTAAALFFLLTLRR